MREPARGLIAGAKARIAPEVEVLFRNSGQVRFTAIRMNGDQLGPVQRSR